MPDDVDDPGVAKERGKVVLPRNVLWSGPQRTGDLSDRRQRAQVYEMVLTDGTVDDARRFIDVDELIEAVARPVERTPCAGRLVRVSVLPAGAAARVLSEFQQEIMAIVVDSTSDQRFALAGGAALILKGLVDRQTRDLHFSAREPEAVDRIAGSVDDALRAAGMSTRRLIEGSTFVRIEVSRGGDVCELDLGVDTRSRPEEPTRSVRSWQPKRWPLTRPLPSSGVRPCQACPT